MTRPNTPPAQADNARLIERVETLERALRRTGAVRLEELEDVIVDSPADGNNLVFDASLRKWTAQDPGSSDGIWEITGSGRKALHPRDALTDTGDPTAELIQWFTLDLKAPQGNTGTGGAPHVTSFYVAPGIGAGGGDVQAETYIEGHEAVMDWFYWVRSDGAAGYEAGSFWDAIGDGTTAFSGWGEAFLMAYAEKAIGTIELLAYKWRGGATGHKYAELDITLEIDDDEVCKGYFDFGGDVDNGGAGEASDVASPFVRFTHHNAGVHSAEVSLPFRVAPDAELAEGDWSIGFTADGTDFVVKINNGGIKTATLTPS